ncbi:MAG TPA: hybrid sensor histidine kinase/response regulator [Syntrophales bacterium]|nr:hybrid sensor histidine kinase/response regulator [Syntrophales bacterium]HPQ44764.1 hybrid sensor histidine kinase/response regulator [Syntrophales bacterium]
MAEKESEGPLLVIDDEETIRDGCRQVLEKSGYTVITTTNGLDGIRIAREKHPALVFVDLKMPGMSGLEIIDVLLEDIPYVVLVVITGYASIVSAVESMKRGAYDYLPKPFTPDQLRAVTKRGLEHRELRIEAKMLRDAKEQIEKDFITFVSHEMRSPLVTIQQYMESLKVVAGDCLSGEARDIIERCDKRIRNLEDLVEHWLDIRHIENGTLIREKERIDLSGVIAQAMEDMKPLCEKRELALEEDIPEDLPMIIGDGESLVRVFVNIIGNATKYTPAGGSIFVHGEYDMHYVSVSVSDTGRGIPADKLPFIFEMFYRVKGEVEDQRGSGLGLAFCKRIMDAHGGKIDVSSQEGKGTTFVLRFPR